MSAFNIWRENPPPRNTWVWSKRSLTRGEWQLVKTCSHGCCVYAFGCSLTLPKYWKDASPEEAAREEAACDAIQPIDPWDMLA